MVTQRLVGNGALFIAAVQGYFKAEGLELQMGAYGSAREVVEAVAAGSADFGLTEFTPTAFNLAGQGAIKAIAAQAREKRDYRRRRAGRLQRGLRQGAAQVRESCRQDRGHRDARNRGALSARRDRARQRFRSCHDVRDRALFEQRDGKSDRERQGRCRHLALAVGARFARQQPGATSSAGCRRSASRRPARCSPRPRRSRASARRWRNSCAPIAAASPTTRRRCCGTTVRQTRVGSGNRRTAAGIIARYVYPDISTGVSHRRGDRAVHRSEGAHRHRRYRTPACLVSGAGFRREDRGKRATWST